MPIDVAVLAGTIVSSFLMPVAKKAVEEVRARLESEVSEKAAEEASSLMNTVWGKVKGLFAADGDENVLEQMEARPEVAAPMVEAMLKDKLEANPQVAEELQEIVQQPAAGGGVSIGSIIAHTVGTLNAPGATISGVAGGVVIGANAPPPPPPPRAQDPDPDPNRSKG